MNRLLILALCLTQMELNAANFFISASARGSNNGSNWTDAWTDSSRIAWSNLRPGDTVWFAGGTYSPFTVQTAGALGSPLSFRRATGQNPECVNAAGWSGSLNSQVVINVPNGSGGAGIRIVPPASDYIVVDGQVSNGIKFVLPVPTVNCNTTMAYQMFGILSAGNGNRFLNLEFSGPAIPSADIGISAGNTTAYGWKKDLYIGYCNFHGCGTALFIGDTDNMTVEHCEMSQSWGNGYNHDNIAYVFSGNHGIFRNNYVHDWGSEGLVFASLWPIDDWKIYGNVFRNDPSRGKAIEFDPWALDGSRRVYGSNWTIVNNTFVDIYLSIRADFNRGGGYSTSGGKAANNVFWNAGPPQFGSLAHDYNFTSGTSLGEAHGVSNGSNPFVNRNGSDFHLSRALPGSALSSEYSPDRDFVPRAGNWDMGAYQYSSGGEVVVVNPPPTQPPPTQPPPTSNDLSFGADAGVITSPFLLHSGVVSQPTETGLAGGGRAVYNFDVSDPGSYIVRILVNAPSEGENSLFVNIDGEPSDPYSVWDIPVTSGNEVRTVGWRGNGAWDSCEFGVRVFTLGAGSHQLKIVGREANTQFGAITLVKVQLPAPPTNLRIAAASP